MLKDNGVLKDMDSIGMYRYRVCGKLLSYGDATLTKVYASEVPILYEDISCDVRGGVRMLQATCKKE